MDRRQFFSLALAPFLIRFRKLWPKRTEKFINIAEFKPGYIEWYLSGQPTFKFGFTDFKARQLGISTCGQFLLSHKYIIASPGTRFKLSTGA